VHHSPTRLNYTSGVRLSWFGVLSGLPLFFLPLVFVGFHPLAVIGTLAVNLFYQFFIHTELSPRWGLLEWVLNTPCHHQVHHASNSECVDKNFGGVLIIFDRLFGTFAEPPKNAPIRYGLVNTRVSYNPFWINGRIWLWIARDVAAAKSWSERFKALFGCP
jgi:sterol desaturase/sphingolipid hydroxylase (fatty acid hydroxylase superfamily)